MVRYMTISDYDNVYKLWNTIDGFVIRSIDDSREGIERFLNRNKDISVVFEDDDKIIGSLLCGHDGRTGYFYHVCVDTEHRNRGIATAMTEMALEALKREKINKVSLIAFSNNDGGNAFWKEIGWVERKDVNFYDRVLNAENSNFVNNVFKIC